MYIEYTAMLISKTCKFITADFFFKCLFSSGIMGIMYNTDWLTTAPAGEADDRYNHRLYDSLV